MKTTAVQLAIYIGMPVIAFCVLALVMTIWKRGKRLTIQVPPGIKVIVEFEPPASKR